MWVPTACYQAPTLSAPHPCSQQLLQHQQSLPSRLPRLGCYSHLLQGGRGRPFLHLLEAGSPCLENGRCQSSSPRAHACRARGQGLDRDHWRVRAAPCFGEASQKPLMQVGASHRGAPSQLYFWRGINKDKSTSPSVCIRECPRGHRGHFRDIRDIFRTFRGRLRVCEDNGSRSGNQEGVP